MSRIPDEVLGLIPRPRPASAIQVQGPLARPTTGARIIPVPAAPPAGWRDEAACAGHPEPELWDAEPQQSRGLTLRALSICSACPVRTACLADAQRHDRTSSDGERNAGGIWGGRSAWGRMHVVEAAAARGEAWAQCTEGDCDEPRWGKRTLYCGTHLHRQTEENQRRWLAARAAERAARTAVTS